MKSFVVRAMWLAIIGGLVSFGLTFHGYAPAPPGVGELMERPWVDHIPRSDREPFRIFIFTEQQDPRGQHIGIVLRAESIYKATIEGFAHRISGKEINFLFLHDNVRSVSAYKLERIKPTSDDLDLKLTLDKDPRNNGQQSIYYSSTQWKEHRPEFMQQVLQPELMAH